MLLASNSNPETCIEFPSSQFSADVLGCNRMGQTDMVYVVDTWNAADPQRRNELDENQVRIEILIVMACKFCT